MDKIIDGLKVNVDEDGTWLHFRSNTGLHCSFCVEAKFPVICAKTITEWAQDRLKDQDNIPEAPWASPCRHCYNESRQPSGYYCAEGEWDDRGTPRSLFHSGDRKRGKCTKRFEIKEA